MLEKPRRCPAGNASAAGTVVAETSFGQVEQLSPQVYAFVANVFDTQGQATNWKAFGNSGLIGGDKEVLVVDALCTPEASAWLARVSKDLFGKRPTRVICTHFHFDHIGGLAGMIHNGVVPHIIQTQRTRELAWEAYGAMCLSETDTPYSRSVLQSDWGGGLYVEPTHILQEEKEPLEIDLGGQKVVLHFLNGHTESDLVVEVPEANIVFGSDLFWNGVFPNFMSSQPAAMTDSVRQVLDGDPKLLVPGHGPVTKTDAPAMQQYLGLLELLETEARRSFDAGDSIEQAVASFSIPAELGRWKDLQPGLTDIVFAKWYEAFENKARAGN